MRVTKKGQQASNSLDYGFTEAHIKLVRKLLSDNKFLDVILSEIKMDGDVIKTIEVKLPTCEISWWGLDMYNGSEHVHDIDMAWDFTEWGFSSWEIRVARAIVIAISLF